MNENLQETYNKDQKIDSIRNREDYGEHGIIDEADRRVLLGHHHRSNEDTYSTRRKNIGDEYLGEY